MQNLCRLTFRRVGNADLEDSQAMSFVNVFDSVARNEDHESLQSSMVERDSSVFKEPIDPKKPWEKRLSPPPDEILVSGTRNLTNAVERKSPTADAKSRNGSPDCQEAASPAILGAKPTSSSEEIQILMAHTDSTVMASPKPALKMDHNNAPPSQQIPVNMPAISSPSRLEISDHPKAQSGTTNHSIEQVVEKPSLPVHGDLRDHGHSEEAEDNIEHDSTHNPFGRQATAALSGTVPCASLPNGDVGIVRPGLEEGPGQTLPSSRPKRKRQSLCRALAPAKKPREETN